MHTRYNEFSTTSRTFGPLGTVSTNRPTSLCVARHNIAKETTSRRNVINYYCSDAKRINAVRQCRNIVIIIVITRYIVAGKAVTVMAVERVVFIEIHCSLPAVGGRPYQADCRTVATVRKRGAKRYVVCVLLAPRRSVAVRMNCSFISTGVPSEDGTRTEPADGAGRGERYKI